MQYIYSKIRRCASDYNMIPPGARVAVGVSGGKDSLLLLAGLAGLRRFWPGGFELEAITLDMGMKGMDLSPVERFCENLDVPLTIIKTQIAEIVFDIRKESHPCSLCAKMRRGALHQAAIERNCRIVALGHHMDDAIETFMLSLLYEGRLSCFRPVTYLDRQDITLIRPLLYIEESDVLARVSQLPVVHNPCPANGHTKRQEVKERLRAMETEVSDVRQKVFGSLRSLPGWAR